MEFERYLAGIRDGLPGWVIDCGTQAAGGYDYVGALLCFAHGFGDATGIVPDCLGAV